MNGLNTSRLIARLIVGVIIILAWAHVILNHDSAAAQELIKVTGPVLAAYLAFDGAIATAHQARKREDQPHEDRRRNPRTPKR